jgi:signal peptidase II
MEETPKEETKKPQIAWKSFLSWTSFAWMALVVFIIDIVTKWVMQLTLKTDGASVAVIKDFWYFTLTHNTFAAFGNWFNIDESNTGVVVTVRIILIIISWAMSGVILWYWGTRLNKKDKLLNAIMALLFAGAVGNLIDRTFYWNGTTGFNGVIDFMCFYLQGPTNKPFAIFNVADASLSIGIVMLVIVLLVRDVKKDKGETPEEQKKEQLDNGSKDTDSKR